MKQSIVSGMHSIHWFAYRWQQSCRSAANHIRDYIFDSYSQLMSDSNESRKQLVLKTNYNYFAESERKLNEKFINS